MSTATVHVALNALFTAWPHTGSGQYVEHLLPALGRVAPRLRITLLKGWLAPRPGDRGENVRKLVWEQALIPLGAALAGADLLHVPYWAPPLISGVPVTTTIHDVIPAVLPEYRGTTLVAAYTRLVGIAARRARRVIVDSECTKRDLVRLIGVPAQRIDVVPLAASPLIQPVVPGTALASCRRQWGLHRPFLLYVGGNDVRKNLPALLRAWARAARRLPGHELVLAGAMRIEPPFFPDLPRLVAELRLPRCRFLGAVSEAQKAVLLSACTAFLWPSRYEGFGLPPLEAMQAGAAVISSDRSAMPEVVGDAGILIAPDDIGSIADAMVAVGGDPALRARLRAGGRAQAAHFTWERTAALTAASYERAARPE